MKSAACSAKKTLPGLFRSFSSVNKDGTCASGKVQLKVDIIPGIEKSRHLVFLHGLFGKGQSF